MAREEFSGAVWNGRRKRCGVCGKWCYWKVIQQEPGCEGHYLCLACDRERRDIADAQGH